MKGSRRVTPKQRVTINAVAERAGVSISTISRVLNGRDRVSPETRARVLAAIRELGYRPSALARGLASKRTQTLGFVIPTLTDPFFMGIVAGVERAAAQSGYSLLVSCEPYAAKGRSYARLFHERRVDGLILVGIRLTRADIEEFQDHHFPVVLIQQTVGGLLPSVTADNYGGAKALVEHLISHGYRRFAYIAGSDYTPDNAERFRAMRETLAAHGLDLPDSCVASGDYTHEGGRRAMTELMERGCNPRAVFAANDQMAGGAILAIKERGLQVPDDIAVVGFDDVALARFTSPPLTTVRQPTYEMGYQAARMVLHAIEFPDERMPLSVVLPTELVRRESCGCKPDSR
nr:LacI family DNA-binding transcriptional regulator [Thermus brevis]